MITKNETLKILNENILSYWHQEMVDSKNGGFYGRMMIDNTADTKAEKSLLLNTGILWSFSATYSVTGNNNYKWMAERAYEYFTRYFLDLNGGGVFWMMDHNSDVIDDSKKVLGQAFAINAFIQYHKVNSYRRSLDYSIGLFELVEQHGFDKENNGYFNAFDRRWDPTDLSKNLDTHLNLLAAYSNLYQVWPEAVLKDQLINLIEVISTKFLGREKHLQLEFDHAWKKSSSMYSYGYDIQASWLLYRAAESLRNEDLIQKQKEQALQLLDVTISGFDKDGGLMAGVSDSDKYWWAQSEALIGLINGWEATKNKEYLDQLVKLWSFIRKHLMDSHGEWYPHLSGSNNKPATDEKMGPDKSPFHATRALLELSRRLPAKGSIPMD